MSERSRDERGPRFAAVTIGAAIEREPLGHGIATRDIIGQVKGVIMEGTGPNEGAAVELLREVSSHMSRELRDAARAVIGYQKDR